MSERPTIPPKKGKLPSVQLPAVTNGQLPVAAKAARPIRALKDFADRADDLKAHYHRLHEARANVGRVCRTPSLADARKYLDDASAGLRGYDERFCALAKDLKLALDEQFNPEDAFDDDYQLTEERVRMHIAMLVGSIPNATPGNPEAYIGMMVEEVMAEDISLPALESACSQIRRTVKFTPSISEVIEAIQEQTELWEPRFDAIYGCEDVTAWLRDELKVATDLMATEKAEAEEKKRADDALRATPLVVGDRVRWRNDKPFDPTLGTITKRWQSSDGFDVFFDIGGSCYVERKDLERVIPNDRGYEVPAEVQKKQRALRPVVGDRVTDETYYRHPECQPHGAGTVIFVGDFEHDGYDDGFTVRFDNGVLSQQWLPFIERLLPCDLDFVAIAPPSMDTAATGVREPACAVSCEEATTLAPHPHNSTGDSTARSGEASHERSNQIER